MLSLYINNKLCDLKGDESISIDYAMMTIDDISKRKSSRSFNFMIPRTVNNTRILEASELVTNTTDVPYRKHDARLLADGIDLGIRFAELVSVSKGYSINLYGSNVSFFDAIKDKKLNELDLSEFNHTYDFATITGSRNNDVGDGYIYPIINYGSDESVMGNIDRICQAGYLLPALYLDDVIEKIVTEAGYTYDNKMLDDADYTDNPIIIPSVDMKKGNKYNAIFNFDADTPTAVSRYGYINIMNVSSINTYDGTYWSLPYPQTYTYQQFVSSGNGLDFRDVIECKYKFTLIVENPTAFTQALGIWISDGASINGHSQLLKQIMVAPGTATYVIEGAMQDFAFFNNQRTMIFFPICNPSITVKAGSTLEILEADVQDLIYLNANIIASALLPDFKQSELISDYCKMFCLVPLVDEEAKTVTLKKYDTITHRINECLDWSDKLDLTIDPEISFASNDYAQNNLFNWLQDGDEKQPTGTNGAILIDNSSLDFEKEIVELKFASTFFDYSLIDMPIPRIGLFEQLIFKKEKKPRLLILYRQSPNDFTDTSDFIYQMGFSSLTLSGADLIPLCRFINTEFEYNLGFENSLLSLNYIAIQGILSGYKNVKCNLRLNASDINKLDFTIPVYLRYFNAYFYVSKISGYKAGEFDSTQVELVKLF